MDFIYLAGLVACAAVVYSIGFKIWANFVYKADLTKYKTADAWAVVTGATSGIGLGFAQELASRGFNIVLVSRSEDKLQAAQKELNEAFPSVQTRTVRSEATQSEPADLQPVVDAVSSLNVTILVNNVGVATEMPTELAESTADDVKRQVVVNCLYSAQFTRVMIPVLKKAKHSVIINLASVASTQTTSPLLGVYAATKAFNRVLSRALSSEVAKSGIEVLSVRPGPVVSNMSKVKRSNFMVPSARSCARGAVNKIGLVDIIPNWQHDFIFSTMDLLPWFLAAPLSLSVIKGVRAKALKKQQRAAKKQ